MKITRHKAARRTLAFYKSRFGLHEPYQVLVDATFCQASLECKIYIKDQLTTYFGGSVSLFTSPCIVEEVRKLGSEFSGAHLINKKFEWRRCRHAIGTKNARECVQDLIGQENKFRLIVATQDTTLKEALREVPGVPIVYINYNAPILEQPSPASKGLALAVTEKKSQMRDAEVGFLNSIIPEAEKKEEPELKPRKKKKANSLSSMKPKAERLAEEKERKRLKNQKKTLKKKARLLAQQQPPAAQTEGTETKAEPTEAKQHTPPDHVATPPAEHAQHTQHTGESAATETTTEEAPVRNGVGSTAEGGVTSAGEAREEALGKAPCGADAAADSDMGDGGKTETSATHHRQSQPRAGTGEETMCDGANKTLSAETDGAICANTEQSVSAPVPTAKGKKRRASKRRGGKNKKAKVDPAAAASS
ncbi:hypothetical protein SARC_08049 [Sphaeroforma arctica JP610]|uniref:PIN domain-containing protein n=1 Tax=Sphaeroforma arctica JP610 TaxID=667725 RepID=A0A0L0FUH6_9EUKA|nr:hypothetical protein SARC_08049 [Sphaeroforma arctica JP610]KNC79563.1 hypothetical protein SARC_08049 [Sphaeroforma arctica JP610]|eukprot:XP_014153465.1 hypothetical protein SARC_08049 [Sphaeroforma arctica JP610]